MGHYTLVLRPERIRAAGRWYAGVAERMRDKGSRAEGTPDRIGDRWQGDAAVVIKADMRRLGRLMRRQADRLDEAAETMRVLAGHYDTALDDLRELNRRHAAALATCEDEVARVAGREDQTLADLRERGVTNRGVVDELREGFGSQRADAYRVRDGAVARLDGDYDALRARVERQTREAGEGLRAATTTAVPDDLVEKVTGAGTSVADAGLDLPRGDAEQRLAHDLEIVRRYVIGSPTGSDPTIDPTGAGPRPLVDLPAGSVSWEESVEDGPLTVGSTTTLSLGDIVLDDQGREWQSSTVATDLRVSLEGAARFRHLEAAISAFTGQRVSFEVTTSPAGQLEGRVPNPFDPTSFQVGESVELTEDFYAGTEQGLTAYKLLHASTSYEVSEGVTAGVQRVDDSIVRVYLGPQQAVTNALRLGFGTDAVNVGLALEQTIKDYELTQVDFDVSTPEGRAAYQAMLLLGTVPDAGSLGPGVVDRVTMTGSDFSRSASLEARIGGFGAGLDLTSSDTSFTWIEHADGSLTYGWSAREGDVTVEGFQRVAADGHTVVDEGYSYRLVGVGKDAADHFNRVYANSDVRVDGDVNVVLDFTAEDLERFRQSGYEQIAYEAGHGENADSWREVFGHDPTVADVRRWIAENADDPARQEMIRPPFMQGSAMWNIARAENPMQLLLPGGFNVYGGSAHWTPDTVVWGLAEWRRQQLAVEGLEFGQGDVGPGQATATYASGGG